MAHFAGLFFVDEEEGVEVLDLGREAHRMAGEIERLDLGHAAAACEQAFPHLAGGAAYSTEQAQAGDDDATPRWPLLHCLAFIHCYLAAFWVFSM
jgi:predicted RNA-binding protein